MEDHAPKGRRRAAAAVGRRRSCVRGSMERAISQKKFCRKALYLDRCQGLFCQRGGLACRRFPIPEPGQCLRGWVAHSPRIRAGASRAPPLMEFFAPEMAAAAAAAAGSGCRGACRPRPLRRGSRRLCWRQPPDAGGGS
ncbi:hypothetical protein ABZP36_034934 [Zizania latifolia]